MKETKVFSLKNISRSFATRAKGQEVTQCVGAIMEASHPKILLVDWNGVRAASPSFVDEFIGGLQSIAQTETCKSQISFTGVAPSIATLLDLVLGRRSFQIGYSEWPDTFDGSQILMPDVPVNPLSGGT